MAHANTIFVPIQLLFLAPPGIDPDDLNLKASVHASCEHGTLRDVMHGCVEQINDRLGLPDEDDNFVMYDGWTPGDHVDPASTLMLDLSDSDNAWADRIGGLTGYTVGLVGYNGEWIAERARIKSFVRVDPTQFEALQVDLYDDDDALFDEKPSGRTVVEISDIARLVIY